MKLMRLVVLGLFSLLLSTGLQAQKAGKKGEKKDKIMEQLDLNDTQQTSMKAINAKYQPQMKAVKENTSISDAEKKAKSKELKAQKMKEIEGVLTPEQMTKYKALKEENKGKKGKKGKKK